MLNKKAEDILSIWNMSEILTISLGTLIRLHSEIWVCLVYIYSFLVIYLILSFCPLIFVIFDYIILFVFFFSLNILPHCRYPMGNEWRVSENSRMWFVLWLTCIWSFPLEHNITQLFLLNRSNILWKIRS